MHPQMSNTYITHAEQYVPAEDTSRVVNQRGMIERVILVILAFDRDHGHLYIDSFHPTGMFMYHVTSQITFANHIRMCQLFELLVCLVKGV